MLYFIMACVAFCIFLITYLVWARIADYEPDTVEYVFVTAICAMISAAWPFTLPTILLFFFVKFVFTRYIIKIVDKLSS